MNRHSIPIRHPELVSGSTFPAAQAVIGSQWMLKRVQHDGLTNYLGGFVAWCESGFYAQRHEGAKKALTNMEGVLAFISQTLRSDESPHPNPSPEGEGLKEAISLEGSVG